MNLTALGYEIEEADAAIRECGSVQRKAELEKKRETLQVKYAGLAFHGTLERERQGVLGNITLLSVTAENMREQAATAPQPARALQLQADAAALEAKVAGERERLELIAQEMARAARQAKTGRK